MKLMVNTIIDEMGRMEERINKKFDKIDNHFDKLDQRLESMQHEINACKLERDSVGLLLKKIDELESRVEN